MSRNWKHRLEHLDVGLLLTASALLCIGLVALYSACAQAGDSPWAGNFAKQLGWLVVASIGFGFAALIPPRVLMRAAYFLYVLSLLSLVLLLIFGKGPGVSRWLPLGPVRLQPSEMAKVALILALARYLSSESTVLTRPADAIRAFLIALVPMALIAKQPNLGTALVLGVILVAMLFWAGMPPFWLFVLASPLLTAAASFHRLAFVGVLLLIAAVLAIRRVGSRTAAVVVALNVAAAVLAPTLWGHLREYQQQRILAFLGLKEDPLGLSYQVIQSKVAIGSGGVFGKGLLHGTQTHLRFLPAQHTDFIFSVVGEELGFLGTSAALLLFGLLFFRCLRLATMARSRFSSLVVIGILSTLAFHVVANVGMVVGLMPVAGLPLPFMSYGGSFLVATLVMVGLLANISMRWDEY